MPLSPSFLVRLLTPHPVLCLAVFVGCATMPKYTFEENPWPFYANDMADREVKERAYFEAKARNEAMNRTWITAGVVRLALLGILAAIAVLVAEAWTGCWDFRRGDSGIFVTYGVSTYLVSIFFTLGNTINHGPAHAALVFSLVMAGMVWIGAGLRYWLPVFLRRGQEPSA
jgi:hypothetical protein